MRVVQGRLSTLAIENLYNVNTSELK